MHYTDGQIVAMLTAAGTVIVGTIGYVSARYGTFTNRQTEIEKNLLEQLKTAKTEILENAKRIDNLERERTAMESAFRVQIEQGAKDRREIEAYYRAVVEKQERDIMALQAANTDLQHANWLLQHDVVGSAERQVIETQITDIRLIEPSKGGGEES